MNGGRQPCPPAGPAAARCPGHSSDMAGHASSLLLLLLLALHGSCLAFRSPLSVFKRFKETTRSFSNECLGTTRPVTPIDSSDFALDIRMPGVTPKE
ncbi:LOW QUALITY PROTEIN: hypothetical protein U0070_011502, partial [Myodes glareolus]